MIDAKLGKSPMVSDQPAAILGLQSDRYRKRTRVNATAGSGERLDDEPLPALTRRGTIRGHQVARRRRGGVHLRPRAFRIFRALA